MAEPLTFLFRFQDDGSSPAGANTAPVGARGGQAAAAMPAQPSRPRRRRSAPAGSTPPRTRAGAQLAQPASGERRQQAERSQRPARHAASEVFDDLLRAVRRIPGPIGKTVGLINDLAEPFQRARRRYRELLESHSGREGRRERGAGRESRQPTDTRPTPRASRHRPATQPQRPPRRRGGASTAAGGQNQSPRQAGRATAASSPASGQPRQRASGNAPQRGQTLQNPPRAPIPSSLSPERQALQRLIDALGPLPESQRELIAALRPLRDLGYKSKDLREGLRDRRERLRADAQEGGQQQPNAAQRHRRRVRRQQLVRQPARRPAQPGRATQVARSTGQAAQQGGVVAGDAAGQAVGRGAAAGAMEGAGGALAGGLMIGLGAVAAIGAATVAFDALVSTVKKLDSLFVGLGQKLAPFSGKLAAANAINAAKNTISDITSAQAIGDKLARYTDARGDLLRKLQRILDILEGWALDALTPLVEHGADILKEMLEGILIIKEFVANFQFSLNPATLAKNFQDAAVKAALKVDELMRRQQNAKNLISLQGMFNGGLTDLIVEGLNFGSGQKPIQPPGMRVGPIPPAGIGGI